MDITCKFSNITFKIITATDNYRVRINLFGIAGGKYSNFTLNRYVFTVGKSEAEHLCVNSFVELVVLKLCKRSLFGVQEVLQNKYIFCHLYTIY